MHTPDLTTYHHEHCKKHLVQFKNLKIKTKNLNKKMNNKANTFKLRGFRSAMVNNRDIERGTSDAAPIRSRHRKKALCFPD